MEVGKGAFYVSVDENPLILLQNHEMCYHCQTILFEITPALFSFNHPEHSLLDGASDYLGDVRSFRKKTTANWMRGELLALAEVRGIDLDLPWKQLPEDFRQTALYGSGGTTVSWSYVHPKNGRSGTITRIVEGAISVLNRLLKKGGNTAEYMQAMTCPVCEGERLARTIPSLSSGELQRLKLVAQLPKYPTGDETVIYFKNTIYILLST